MADYTTPFFGDRDLGEYAPPALDLFLNWDYRNRQESIKRNEKKQVYEADVFLVSSCHTQFYNSALSKQMKSTQFTVEGQSDKPIAILAVPSTYGNIQYTASTQRAKVWAGCAKELHDIPTFEYFLLSHNKGASLTQRYDNIAEITPSGETRYKYSVDNIQAIYTSETGYTTELPPIINKSIINTSVSGSKNQRGATVGMSLDGLVLALTEENSNTSHGVKWYSYDHSVGMNSSDMLAELDEKLNDWKSMTNSVYSQVRCWSMYGFQYPQNSSIYNPLGSPVLYKNIGTYIATGFPVFTLQNFDQMVSYFQGGAWISDNDEVPPEDWSTDWDIYVKGAQKPNIFITMKSKKLDDWLENLDENKSGMQKSDIKVEYRYRYYTQNLAAINLYNSDYTLVNWIKDNYNETRDTDYVSNIELNYENINTVITGGSEFAEGGIQDAIQFGIYAQLEFRLHYGEYKSTWCRYKIGVIGSPSVPDFSKMQNEGVQDDDWQDDSTVTLHYDSYPPDYDPYPTPPVPPSPPPKPTDPIPSINGTGLLTTTYKITDEQAQALGRFFWGKDIFQKIKALNLSPIENVVALTYMPINIAGQTSVIVIGDVDTNINGDKISGTTPIYSLGKIMVEGRYHSFLDYAPYTTAHIFLPFVGFVPIDPQVFTGKTLEVKYSYDIIAGVCNAMLFANGIYVESHQGNCGIDIPLVASNRAEVVLGIVSSLASTAVSPVNPKSNIALDVLNMGSDIASAISSFHSNRQGSYSPACAWTETRECYLVIETPNAWMDRTYAHDYGRPYLSSANIGQLSGFTVCDQTVDVSGIGGATEEEKQQIREILTGGFYA